MTLLLDVENIQAIEWRHKLASLTEIWIHIGECEISDHKVCVYLAYYLIIASLS